MLRTISTLVIGAVLGFGMTHAGGAGHGMVSVKVVSERDVVEKLDGKDIKASVVEVTIDPGQGSMPHRHTGPVFGYVLEGDYEIALNDQPVKKLKAGDTFYESLGTIHRVSRNPSEKTKTRLLAVILPPRDAKELTVPVGAKK